MLQQLHAENWVAKGLGPGRDGDVILTQQCYSLVRCISLAAQAGDDNTMLHIEKEKDPLHEGWG